MKLPLLLSACVMLLLLPDNIHSAVPGDVDSDPVASAPVPVQSLAPGKSHVMGKNFIQKAGYKILLKKYRKHAKRHGAAKNDTGRSAEILSTISLIAGVTGIILFLSSSLFGLGLVLGLIALICGILSVSDYYKTRGSKRKSIIGIILGSVISFIGLVWAFVVIMMGGFY